MKRIIPKSDVFVIVAIPPEGEGDAFVADVVDSEELALDLVVEMDAEWPQYTHTVEDHSVRGYES